MCHSKDYAVLLALVLLSVTLFFIGLGATRLFDADEPAYAQAAREMLEGGDWVAPHFNGQPRFDKPILFYWLILLSYRAFGITEFAVRFWSALAGLGLVALLWRAVRRRIGGEAALLLGGIAASLLARARWRPMLLAGPHDEPPDPDGGPGGGADGLRHRAGLAPRVRRRGSRHRPAGDPALVYGLNAPSIVLYADGRVRPIGAGALGEVEAAVRGLGDGGRPAVVITRSCLTSRLKDIQGLALRKSAGGYALYVSSR